MKDCSQRRWEIAEPLADNDRPAFSRHERPGYERLLDLVTDERVDVDSRDVALRQACGGPCSNSSLLVGSCDSNCGQVPLRGPVLILRWQP